MNKLFNNIFYFVLHGRGGGHMSRALLALFPVSGQTHFRSRYIGIDWKGDGFIGGGGGEPIMIWLTLWKPSGEKV